MQVVFDFPDLDFLPSRTKDALADFMSGKYTRMELSAKYDLDPFTLGFIDSVSSASFAFELYSNSVSLSCDSAEGLK